MERSQISLRFPRQQRSAPIARIVASKLSPRRGVAQALARPRLLDLLQRQEAVKLVLVRAPAGFGKTTFMRELFEDRQARGISTAWLTLDDADNDAWRFIAYMVAAFQAIDPTLALVKGSDASGERRGDIDGAALDLVHHMSMQESKFTIFLDNFEVIQNSSVLGVVRMLLDTLPPEGQVVLGSRELPAVGLGRLRAHGYLAEVGRADLRFSDEEARTLLQTQSGCDLTNVQLRLLQQCTDGWAAALWLVSMSLRERIDIDAFIRSFSGSNAAVAEYLLEDVLSRQPKQVRDFLLDASVLDELSVDSCNSITGRKNSQELLAYLEKASLFVVPQDPELKTFRYHALFRDFLYAQLKQSDPQRAAQLHRSAACWYADRDQPVLAVEHASRSGDADYGIAYLSKYAEPLLWHGRVRLLIRLFDRLPEACSPHAPVHLQLIYAWALTSTGRYADAMCQLDRLSPRDESEHTQQAASVLRALIFAMSDRVADALDCWQASLGRISDEQVFLLGTQHNSLAFCLIAANRFEDAKRVLCQAREYYAQIGSAVGGCLVACLEGSIELAQGRPREAAGRFRAALAATTAVTAHQLSSGTIAVAFLAETLYQLGQLREAEQLLDTYLPLLGEVAAPDQIISSHIVLARIKQRKGDRPRAVEILEGLESIGHRQHLPRLVCSAQLEHSRMNLFEGDFDAAAVHLARAEDREAWHDFDGFVMHANDIENPFAARIRLQIHTGHAHLALEPLKHAIEQAGSQSRLRRQFHLRLLLGLALARTGDQDNATLQLQTAAIFSLNSGLTQMVEDEGPLVRDLMAPWRQPGMPQEKARRTEALLEQAGAVAPTVRDAPDPGASLSMRELGLLKLLAEGHSNREIAESLHIAESTVKTHLKNINAKLGASNRTHAVAVARRNGLLPSV